MFGSEYNSTIIKRYINIYITITSRELVYIDAIITLVKVN